MKRSRKFGISLFVACACMVAPVQSALAGASASTNRESTVDEDEHFFGGPLDSDDMAVVAALTAAQMDAIDAAVLLDVPARWAKVAMVLGKQLKSRPGIPDDVPLEYYWQRLSRLVTRVGSKCKVTYVGQGTARCGGIEADRPQPAMTGRSRPAASGRLDLCMKMRPVSACDFVWGIAA